MKQEDIIRMAREAGFAERDAMFRVTFVANKNNLERFAALVEEAATEAANARANTSWSLMCKKMVAAEKEACAKVAEEWLGPTKDRELHIAAAIRARGQA